jgi:hypothetical protein
VRRLAANEIEQQEQGPEAHPPPGLPMTVLAGAGPLSPSQVLALQRAAGNGAVAKLMLAREPAAPASAPAAPAAPATAPQTPTGPTPEDPSSGIDWEAILAGPGPSLIRTGLEVTRAIPVGGLFTGGISDAVNAVQDMRSVASVAPPELLVFMAGRHAIAIFNSVLGHAVYCVELVQDVATASVAGAEFDALTVPLNGLLLSGKLAVDGFQTGLDLLLRCSAMYGRFVLPGDDAAKAAWQGMLDNYDANLLGDLGGAMLDAYDFGTVGFGNAQVVKTAATTAKEVFAACGFLKTAALTVLQGWWNVWGGNAPGVIRSLPTTVAGALIVQELMRMKTAYALADLAIDETSELFGALTAELELRAQAMLGGRDPFIAAREAAVAGLETMEGQIEELRTMHALTTDGAQKAAEVDEACGMGLALLDTLALPEPNLPDVELGEGAAADLAEDALNLGGMVLGAGLDVMMARVAEEVELIKGTLREPLETIRANAAAMGTFLQILTDEAAEMLAEAEERTARFREELARCEDFEDVTDTLIDQIFEVLGMGEGFEVEDVREGWAELGIQLDEALIWAEALRDGRDAPMGIEGEEPG